MLGADYLYLMIIIFIVAAVAFAFTLTGQMILPALNSIPGYNAPIVVGNSVFATTPYQATASILAIYPNFDQYIPWIFIIVSIAILASVAFLPVNAVTIAITFVLMLITVFVSFIFSNTTHLFFANPIWANVAPLYPSTEALFANLGEYEVGFFFLYIIMIAARSKISGNAGTGGQITGGATIGFG